MQTAALPSLWPMLSAHVSLVPPLRPEYRGFISFGGGTSLMQQTCTDPLLLHGHRVPSAWAVVVLCWVWQESQPFVAGATLSSVPHCPAQMKQRCPPFPPTLLTPAVIFPQAQLSAQPGLQAGLPPGPPASVANSPCFSPRCPLLRHETCSFPGGDPRRKALSVSGFWAVFQAHAWRKGAWGGGGGGGTVKADQAQPDGFSSCSTFSERSFFFFFQKKKKNLHFFFFMSFYPIFNCGLLPFLSLLQHFPPSPALLLPPTRSPRR